MSKRVILFNSFDYGSTGKLCRFLKENKNKDFLDTLLVISDKRTNCFSDYSMYENSSKLHRFLLGIKAKFFNTYGFMSKSLTKKVLKFLSNKIDLEKENVIFNIHQIESSYFHLGEIIKFAKKHRIKVVFTLHDCWLFTGKCPHYEMNGCFGWKNDKCKYCKYHKEFPRTYSPFLKTSFLKKINLIQDYSDNVSLICPSAWICKQLNQSELKNIKKIVIHNGIEIPKEPLLERHQPKIGLIACAYPWTLKKGLFHLMELSNMLDYSKYSLTIVGTKRVSGFSKKTIFYDKLAQNHLFNLYKINDYFLNPTLEDNFPTVNIEALAFGLKIISYDTGGSCESFDKETGIVSKSNANSLANICYNLGKNLDRELCIKRAKTYFSREKFVLSYYNLFREML